MNYRCGVPDNFRDFREFAAERARPLDDLAPLAEVCRSARVVAIGESAHWIAEYHEVRNRLVKFLVERCGVTVVAAESGYSEGLGADAWVQGGPGEVAEVAARGLTYRMGRPAEMPGFLTWLRECRYPVRFLGLDVPGSAASAMPALESVRRDLTARDDKTALGVLEELVGLVQNYAGEHQLPAYAAYALHSQAQRDRVAALFADLAVRLDVAAADASVRHELRLAALLDQMLRGNVAARDLGMAETALTMVTPGEKVVVAAHNSHIQRTVMRGPGFVVPTLGHHLARRHGEEFVSIALTATSGITTTRHRDPEAPGGVAVTGETLPPAREDSIEAAFGELTEPLVLDLRAARGVVPGPSSLRVMDGWQEAPMLQAYDLAVVLPDINPSVMD